MGESMEDAILEGKYGVVYSSPEQLLQRSKWREMLQSEVYQKNLVAIVVDEAHCVKQWKVLVPPMYLLLSIVVKLYEYLFISPP